MNLDTYGSSDELYLARGNEVNPNRPIFTGDVFADVTIPGVDDGGMATLTDVAGPGFWVAHLDDIGRCSVTDLHASVRVACLSAFGVNMLQQRMTCHLTRAEIPTAAFEQAFSHTFEEAELLEEWTDTLAGAGWTIEAAAAEFEKFIRSGETTWQERLKEPQMRPAVRRACRGEARRLAQASPQP